VGEKGEELPAWAPSFRLVQRGECSDIGYLPITSAMMCKEALEQLRPRQKLLRSDVRSTIDPHSPYGCFLLLEHDREDSPGQLWIGSSLAYGVGQQHRQRGQQDDHRHALCKSEAYEADFLHRWTSKTLRSEVVELGDSRSIVMQGSKFHLKLPEQGHGVTGLLFSDPCFSSRGGVSCPNGRHMHVLSRLTEVINALLSSDEFDFWAILGNSFYDQNGTVSSEFFQRLSTSAKLKPLFTVPGNYDFWIDGRPPGSRNDSLGYGFMQFYGQDTAAATPLLPYHWAGKPDSLQPAKAENFMVASQLGDLALFGYSGAHTWSMTGPHAARFCRFAGETSSVSTVLVLGHWAAEETGCSPGMDVPSVHARMKRMDGCSSKRVLYFAGHTHCNRVDKVDEGFLVGGAGMQSPGCSQLGVTVLQSDPKGSVEHDVQVDYFPIHEESNADSTDSLMVKDYYYDLIGCLREHGYSGCRERHSRPFRRARQVAITTTATTTATSTSSGSTAGNLSHSQQFANGANGKTGARQGPDWLQPVYRTPEPVDQFVSMGGPGGVPERASRAEGGPSAGRFMTLRVLGVTAALLLLVGLAVYAWFWISWRNHLRKTSKCCHSPRRLLASSNSPRGGRSNRHPDVEDCEPETINVAHVPPRERLAPQRMGGKQEPRYTPLGSSDPDVYASRLEDPRGPGPPPRPRIQDSASPRPFPRPRAPDL